MDKLTRENFFEAFKEEAMALVHQKILPRDDAQAIASAFARIASDLALRALNDAAPQEDSSRFEVFDIPPVPAAPSAVEEVEALAFAPASGPYARVVPYDKALDLARRLEEVQKDRDLVCAHWNYFAERAAAAESALREAKAEHRTLLKGWEANMETLKIALARKDALLRELILAAEDLSDCLHDKEAGAGWNIDERMDRRWAKLTRAVVEAQRELEGQKEVGDG